MKTVFTNREIPHLWAHATQAHARGNSLRFEGDTLFSYSTPIAKIYRNKRGAFALLSECNYSATTSKHISYARGAIPPEMKAAFVPSYAFGHYYGGRYRGESDARKAHAANFDYLVGQLARIAERAGRVKTEDAVTRECERAAEYHKGLADYMIFFGVRRKMPPMPSFAAAFERARGLEHPDPVRDAKRFKAAEARKAAVQRAIDGAAPYWREYGTWPKLPRHARSVTCATLLRVQGEEIVTSMGARVPLAAAPMVWNLVQRAIAAGGFSKGLRTVMLGDYPLDSVDADGTLRAGCHVIPFAELELLARKLGLEGA